MSANLTAEQTADLVGEIACDYRAVIANEQLTYEMKVGYLCAVAHVDERIPSHWVTAGQIAFAEMVLLAAGLPHPWSAAR